MILEGQCMERKKYERIELLIMPLELTDVITTSQELFDKVAVDLENWEE